VQCRLKGGFGKRQLEKGGLGEGVISKGDTVLRVSDHGKGWSKRTRSASHHLREGGG